MTPFFPETGEGWREKGTKTPFVLAWGALRKIIISFMKVHRKKWKKPTERMDSQGKKITFPLCLCFMPSLTTDETAMDGGGLLQEASWGFCSMSNRNEGALSALRVLPPFIKAANLWPFYNDQSFPSLGGPAWWKDATDRHEDNKENRIEDHAIWIGVWHRIQQH